MKKITELAIKNARRSSSSRRLRSAKCPGIQFLNKKIKTLKNESVFGTVIFLSLSQLAFFFFSYMAAHLRFKHDDIGLIGLVDHNYLIELTGYFGPSAGAKGLGRMSF